MAGNTMRYLVYVRWHDKSQLIRYLTFFISEAKSEQNMGEEFLWNAFYKFWLVFLLNPLKGGVVP